MQVDINGDGSMEWEEFTSFIVEMGMAEHDHQPDAISKYYGTSQKETGNHYQYVSEIRSFVNDTIGVVDVESKQMLLYNAAFDLLGECSSRVALRAGRVASSPD